MALDGGTIVDASGNDAVLTLASPGDMGSLESNSNIVIDATTPSITNVHSATDNGTYGTSATIIVSLSFSEPVTVTGTPELSLNSGGTATYFGGSGNSTIYFTYSPTTGDNSSLLEYSSTSALTLDGGTIDSAAGISADLTLPSPGGSGSLSANTDIVIVTTPTVAEVSSTTANGYYTTGDVIDVTVLFTETVYVTGTPQITLANGGSGAVVDYSSGSGTDTLTFDYTVSSGDNATHLDCVSTSALAFNGGTIEDVDDNNATLTLATPGAAGSLSANTDIVIDTTTPTVSNVTSTNSNGTYTTGDAITITVAFTEAVVVTGTPELALNSGGTAYYASGSGTSTLSFTYTVSSGDTSTQLEYSSTSALTLSGGTIADVAGNNADLTLATPGAADSLSANTYFVINPTAPSLVQDYSGTTASTTDVTVQFNSSGSATTAGDLLIVAIAVTGTNTITPPSGWTLAVDPPLASHAEAIYYYMGAPSMTTVTFTTSGGVSSNWVAAEFNAGTLAGTVDQTATNGSTSGTASNSGTTAANASSNELAVAFLTTYSGVTIGTPLWNSSSIGTTVTVGGSVFAFDILSSTGTQEFSGTNSTSTIWAGCIATFD